MLNDNTGMSRYKCQSMWAGNIFTCCAKVRWLASFAAGCVGSFKCCPQSFHYCCLVMLIGIITPAFSTFSSPLLRHKWALRTHRLACNSANSYYGGDLAEAVFSRHFRVRSESWTWQYPGKPPHLGLSPATDYQNAVTANTVKHSKEEWRSCGDVVRSRWIMYNHWHFLWPLSDNTVAKSPPMSSLETFSSRNWLVQKLLIRAFWKAFVKKIMSFCVPRNMTRDYSHQPV